MDGVFQELVLAGLLLLIVLVAVATLIIVRRSRHSGTPGRLRRKARLGRARDDEAASDGAHRGWPIPFCRSGGRAARSIGDGSKLLESQAESLMTAARTARADAAEENRVQRTEMREQRAELERREQRLSDREERLDVEARSLDDKLHHLEEQKADLRSQRKSLAETQAEQQATLERIAGLTSEQAKAELVARWSTMRSVRACWWLGTSNGRPSATPPPEPR